MLRFFQKQGDVREETDGNNKRYIHDNRIYIIEDLKKKKMTPWFQKRISKSLRRTSRDVKNSHIILLG